MAGQTLTSSRGDASVKPTKDASLELDFYLPPPDYRAYRWGNIQRLRDQITAWRRNARRKGQPAQTAEEVPPRWNSASVSPTRRCPSRLEKLLMQSEVLTRSQRAKTASHMQGSHSNRHSRPFGSANTSSVTTVPYFHDYISICLPRGDDTDPVDAGNAGNDGRRHGEKNPSEFCYAVTASHEDVAHQLEVTSQGGTGFPSVKSGSGLHDTLANRAVAIRAQCVELAMSVHKECTRDLSVSQTSRMGRSTPHIFNKTMEIPIDWNEFGRVSSPDGAASLAASPSSDHHGAAAAVDAARAETCAGPNNPAASIRRAETSWPLLATDFGRRPLRLYTIQMQKSLSNSIGSMEKRAEAPRLGRRVKLPKAWISS